MFRSLKSMEGDIVESMDSYFHRSRVGPQHSRSMQSSSLHIFLELIDSFISFCFNLVLYSRMTDIPWFQGIFNAFFLKLSVVSKSLFVFIFM